MSYRLSILDKVPVGEGGTPAQAFEEAVALAVRAEELGFHRYWFAEHHGFPGVMSSAPEVIAAFVLARTRRIRVGTGGVMLQHYAPYKVAEVFNVLSALAPGRVDLGVGRAPGGFPLSTRALRSGLGDSPGAEFATKLTELDALLSSALPSEHPLAGVSVVPQPAVHADRILLGASVESAELAARHGWLYCYAGHFDGDPGRVERTFAAFRAYSGRAPLFSLVVLVAESAEEARARRGEQRLFRVHLSTGQTVNLPTLEAAREFARQAGATHTAEEIHPQVLAGTAEVVQAELDRLHARFGIEEFVIDTPAAGFVTRRASLERLGEVARSRGAS